MTKKKAISVIAETPAMYEVREIQLVVRDRAMLPVEIDAFVGTAFGGSADIFHAFLGLSEMTKECFIAVHLDGKNKISGICTVSVGSLNWSIVHPREVFAPAIRNCAAALIFVHNHPSGHPDPSREDLEITRRLVEVGEIC